MEPILANPLDYKEVNFQIFSQLDNKSLMRLKNLSKPYFLFINHFFENKIIAQTLKEYTFEILSNPHYELPQNLGELNHFLQRYGLKTSNGKLNCKRASLTFTHPPQLLTATSRIVKHDGDFFYKEFNEHKSLCKLALPAIPLDSIPIKLNKKNSYFYHSERKIYILKCAPNDIKFSKPLSIDLTSFNLPPTVEFVPFKIKNSLLFFKDQAQTLVHWVNLEGKQTGKIEFKNPITQIRFSSLHLCAETKNEQDNKKKYNVISYQDLQLKAPFQSFEKEGSFLKFKGSLLFFLNEPTERSATHSKPYEKELRIFQILKNPSNNSQSYQIKYFKNFSIYSESSAFQEVYLKVKKSFMTLSGISDQFPDMETHVFTLNSDRYQTFLSEKPLINVFQKRLISMDEKCLTVCAKIPTTEFGKSNNYMRRTITFKTNNNNN